MFVKNLVFVFPFIWSQVSFLSWSLTYVQSKMFSKECNKNQKEKKKKKVASGHLWNSEEF